MNIIRPITSLCRRLVLGEIVQLSQLHQTLGHDSRIDSRFDELIKQLRAKYSDSESIHIYSPDGWVDYCYALTDIKIRPNMALDGRVRDILPNLIIGVWTGNLDILKVHQQLRETNGKRCLEMVSDVRLEGNPYRDEKTWKQYDFYRITDRTERPNN